MHDAKYLESLDQARELAAKNGGVLPPATRLIDGGYHEVIKAIRVDRKPFEPILAKQGRGRDKNKYAYVADHMDEPSEKLAKDTGLSKTTITNWKTEILESQFIEPNPSEIPRDASVEDMVKFVVRNMPEGWKLDVSHDADGCYVSLVQPNGMRRSVNGVAGAGIAESIAAHVNHARKKAGMEPAEWEG